MHKTAPRCLLSYPTGTAPVFNISLSLRRKRLIGAFWQPGTMWMRKKNKRITFWPWFEAASLSVPHLMQHIKRWDEIHTHTILRVTRLAVESLALCKYLECNNPDPFICKCQGGAVCIAFDRDKQINNSFYGNTFFSISAERKLQRDFTLFTYYFKY